MDSAARSAPERPPPVPAEAALHAAREQGLRYVGDAEPGIRRVRRGRGFVYTDPDGRRVTDAALLARIASLAIPPAYRDVWICSSPLGHIQATARDAKGRKQYRYHPRWRAHRDATKFDRLLEFERALPRIRRKVAADLARPGLPRERVLATIVRLLESTRARVGNEEYARSNGSFGLTTLRDRHVEVDGGTLHFEFRGKSGIVHAVSLSDPALARIVRRCQDIPGQELFQWVDAAGGRRRIDSSDVNEYLREASGSDFTAKDFRTWLATVEALERLRGRRPRSQREARRQLAQVVAEVAAWLGNTPAVCRKCYIHPRVLASFLDGRLAALQGMSRAAALRRLLRGAPSGPGRRRGQARRVANRAGRIRATRASSGGRARPSASRA